MTAKRTESEEKTGSLFPSLWGECCKQYQLPYQTAICRNTNRALARASRSCSQLEQSGKERKKKEEKEGESEKVGTLQTAAQ